MWWDELNINHSSFDQYFIQTLNAKLTLSTILNLMQSDKDKFLDGIVCVTQIATTVVICKQFQQK